MRRILFSAIVALTTLVARADERPNFLLIMSDDSTWSDFGFTGVLCNSVTQNTTAPCGR